MHAGQPRISVGWDWAVLVNACGFALRVMAAHCHRVDRFAPTPLSGLLPPVVGAAGIQCGELRVSDDFVFIFGGCHT